MLELLQALQKMGVPIHINVRDCPVPVDVDLDALSLIAEDTGTFRATVSRTTYRAMQPDGSYDEVGGEVLHVERYVR